MIDKAVDAYKAKFGDVPTLVNLPMVLEPAIAALLDKAVSDGKPLTDDEFLRKLGLRPPPEGATV